MTVIAAVLTLGTIFVDQSASSPSIISSSVHLVQASVIVTDAHGRHIAGLRAGDFHVIDNGASRTPVFLTENRDLARVPSQNLGVFTNRQSSGAARGEDSRVIILFDALNTVVTDQSSAYSSLLASLESARLNRPIAVYRLTTQLIMLTDFTTDRARLLAAAKRCAPTPLPDRESGTPESSHTGLPIDGPINRTSEIIARYALPERRAGPTLAAIGALAQKLAAFDGRKNLIWISGGFPISSGLARTLVSTSAFRDGMDFSAELQRLSRTLLNSNIAVYPVAADGQRPLDTGITATVPVIGARSSVSAAVNLNEATPDFGSTATMAQIASLTGGAFSISNDIEGRLNLALEDSRADYLVGFYASDWDGKYHQIKVTVSRAGARVRTRRGYFAVDDTPRPDADSKLDAASASEADMEEVPIDMAAAKSVNGAEVTITTRIQVPGSSIVFGSGAAGWTARVRLRFLQLDSAGKEIMRTDKVLALDLSDVNHAKALGSSLRFTTPIPIRESATTVRVILQDEGTGRTGSITVPVAEIPARTVLDHLSQRSNH